MGTIGTQFIAYIYVSELQGVCLWRLYFNFHQGHFAVGIC